MTQLTANFTLDEFLVSQTAARHGIDMTPDEDIEKNLKRLAETCMQPIRDQLAAPVIISSGYRPKKLNKLIGGSKTSVHPKGRAADFRVVGYTAREAAEIIQNMSLPVDQLILEFPESARSWIHLGIAEDGEEPRGQVLTAKRGEDGKTIYSVGLV